MPLVLEQMALPRSDLTTLPLDLYRNAWNDIEDYDKVILITWNPKPRFYNYDHNGDNDFEMQWRTMLDKLFEANRCCSRYAFVAEVSDAGKLHMHGFLVVSDKIKYYKKFLPTLRANGFIKIPKANSHKWKTFKYHVKEVDFTSDLIKDSSIVLTHHNYKQMRRELTVFKCMVLHSYDAKVLRKKNVMAMLNPDLDFISQSE